MHTKKRNSCSNQYVKRNRLGVLGLFFSRYLMLRTIKLQLQKEPRPALLHSILRLTFLSRRHQRFLVQRPLHGHIFAIPARFCSFQPSRLRPDALAVGPEQQRGLVPPPRAGAEPGAAAQERPPASSEQPAAQAAPPEGGGQCPRQHAGHSSRRPNGEFVPLSRGTPGKCPGSLPRRAHLHLPRRWPLPRRKCLGWRSSERRQRVLGAVV